MENKNEWFINGAYCVLILLSYHFVRMPTVFSNLYGPTFNTHLTKFFVFFIFDFHL